MADIIISGIECTETNVLKVLDFLPLKDIIVEIGDVKKNDILFEKVKQLSLKYTTSIEGDSPYYDIIFMTKIEQFKQLVRYVFESDSESFSITSINDAIQWEQYMCSRTHIRKLIKQGKIDASMDVAIQESTISISLSKETYSATNLVKKSKEIKKMF